VSSTTRRSPRSPGEVEGVHYIAYDYVHGRDLRAIQERLRRGGPPGAPGRRSTLDGEPRPVALDVAIYIVLRVAEALAHAHARCDGAGRPLRLVHRDVSPSNVLVAFDGEVKLLDFGIARVGLPSYPPRLVRTDTGQVKGTVGYMSPEQVEGEPVDARSDVYALGVCFWELCTGRRLLEAMDPAAAGASAANSTSLAGWPRPSARGAGRAGRPPSPPAPSARGAGSYHPQGAREFPRGAVRWRHPLPCGSLPAGRRRGRARGPCSRRAICAKSVPRSSGGGSRVP
jgi:serine/threonine protein kinase